jgi:hypothetical protein
MTGGASVLSERPRAAEGGDATIVAAGVIKEARRRQRRRRAAVALALLAAGLAGLGVLREAHPGSTPDVGGSRWTPSPLILDPSAVFSQTPYMGVACGIPNSIGCDRIGLAIWLRRPALTVTATIAGRSFALDDREWSGPEHDGARTRFAGFLAPAGITTALGVRAERGRYWSGSGTPSPLVIVRIVERDHRAIEVWTNVDLMAGWG